MLLFVEEYLPVGILPGENPVNQCIHATLCPVECRPILRRHGRPGATVVCEVPLKENHRCMELARSARSSSQEKKAKDIVPPRPAAPCPCRSQVALPPAPSPLSSLCLSTTCSKGFSQVPLPGQRRAKIQEDQRVCVVSGGF